MSQIAGVASSRAISAGAQAITLVLLARNTTPTTFGLITTLIAASSLVSLADGGLQNYAFRAYATERERPDALKALYLQALGVSAASAVLLMVLGLLCIIGVLPVWALLVPPWVAIDRMSNAALGVQVAAGNPRLQVTAMGSSRVLTLSIFASAIALGAYAPGWFWISAIVGGGVGLIVLRSGIPNYDRPASAQESRQLVRLGMPFWIANVGAVIRSTDVSMVTAVAGASQGAYYALPVRLMTPLTMAMDSLAVAVLPQIRRGNRTAVRIMNICAGSAFLVAVAFGGAAIWNMPLAISLLIGPSYVPGAQAARFVVVATVLGLAESYLTRYLQALGHERPVGRVHIALAGVAAIAIPVGALIDGAVGAAIGLCGVAVLEAVSLLVLLVWSRSEKFQRVERSGGVG